MFSVMGKKRYSQLGYYYDISDYDGWRSGKKRQNNPFVRRCSQANQSRYLARKSWRVELNYVVLLSLRNLPDSRSIIAFDIDYVIVLFLAQKCGLVFFLKSIKYNYLLTHVCVLCISHNQFHNINYTGQFVAPLVDNKTLH